MRQNKKNIKNLAKFIGISILIIPFLTLVKIALADCPSGMTCLEVPLGQTSQVSGPAEYIHTFIIFGLGLVGVAALAAITYGGFLYLISGGSETRKSEGKDWITGAVWGVLLLLCSYLILNTINPDLVKLTVNLPKPISLSTTEWQEKMLDIPDIYKDYAEAYTAGEQGQWAEAAKDPNSYTMPPNPNAGHPKLKELVSCIQKAVPPMQIGFGAGSGNIRYQVQEYVDSGIGTTCKPSLSTDNKTCPAGCLPPKKCCNNSCCWHACKSDHYGYECGGRFSYAADLSTKSQNNPSLQCSLARAARSCDKEKIIQIIYGSKEASRKCDALNYEAGHTTHIHISIKCQ